MRKVALLAAPLLAVVAWDFLAATTFLGDDFLFLAFARLHPSPLDAFTSDLHGGEYFRPLPMLLWWLLGRAGAGAEWPFAFAAFALHAGAAALLAVLGLRLGLGRRVSLLAGALFLLAPAQREAALWFSASTDLLATVATLASLTCLLGRSRGALVASAALAALAYLSKESALVLPLLGAALLWARARDRPAALLLRLAPHAVLAAACLALRTAVLRGLGGSNDPLAPWWGRALQIGSGLLHAVTAYQPIPDELAWLLGLALIGGATLVAARSRPGLLALLWVLIAVLPLPAAGWVVGARYFYLPAAGLMLALALAAESRGPAAGAVLLLLFAGLGLAASQHRTAEVRRFRATLAASRDAVRAQVAAGHRVFLVRGAVKDLDLALKLRAAIPRDALVLPDVPASFIWIPDALASRAAFLLADPPLPPAGAYRFGPARIAGLARREEAPDLDEVLARLPELRILELHAHRNGNVEWRDLTASYPR